MVFVLVNVVALVLIVVAGHVFLLLRANKSSSQTPGGQKMVRKKRKLPNPAKDQTISVFFYEAFP